MWEGSPVSWNLHVLYTLLFTALTVLAQEQPGSNALSSTALCKQGVSAFEASRYEEAAQSFREAAQMDPGNQQAHFYLGRALAVQVIPNLQTPENIKMASLALSELDTVLKMDPRDVPALTLEGTIFRNTQQLEKAKTVQKEITSIDPENAEALYTIGVIDWQQSYKNSIMVLTKEGLTDDGLGNPKLSNAGCDLLEQLNAGLVSDALTSLQEAVRINATYDDAMIYISLIYRRRAEIHCHNRADAELDIKLATEWSQQARTTRKANIH